MQSLPPFASSEVWRQKRECDSLSADLRETVKMENEISIYAKSIHSKLTSAADEYEYFHALVRPSSTDERLFVIVRRSREKPDESLRCVEDS